METKNWKLIAVIFITLFVITNTVWISLFAVGTSVINKETDCIEYCDQIGFTYYFDMYSGVCKCYDLEGEVTGSTFFR